MANEQEVLKEYGIISTINLPKEKFDCIVLTVSHKEFLNIDFSQIKNENAIIYDVKNFLLSNVKNKTL